MSRQRRCWPSILALCVTRPGPVRLTLGPSPPRWRSVNGSFWKRAFPSHFLPANARGEGSLNPATSNNPSLRASDSTQPQVTSCRTCHLVDEFRNRHPGGVRSYTDFAQRSPIPRREDGLSTTTRNSPTLVDATRSRHGPMVLHFDGEFASSEELVRGTLTGRNFGWLPTEQALAIAHIAAVIRDDDGEGDLARLYGGIPYSDCAGGSRPFPIAGVPAPGKVPPRSRAVDRPANSQRNCRADGRLHGFTEIRP